MDRFLRIFSDVPAGEGANALLLMLTIFLLLVAYYIIKVVREPLILGSPGGAELKSYASAGQAIALMGFVPLYGWFSSRVDRPRLILSVGLFFLVAIEAFALGVLAGVPYIGVVFYVFVGIFSLSTIAQFWAFANDLYSEDEGRRLFPLIGIGATAGSPIGSFVAERLFRSKLEVPVVLQVAALLLGAHVALALFVHARDGRSARARTGRRLEPLSGRNGFSLVLESRYLRTIAALFLILNAVNTVGEYIVSTRVSGGLAAAMAAAGLTHLEVGSAEVEAFKASYFGAFYGSYFSVANVVAVVLQAFVVSRLVDRLGLRGALFCLPIISVCSNGLMAAAGGLTVARWAKTAENAADYSVMNTARAMLWLPTSREEKYIAKQAIDTFFVRFGDVLAAVLIWVGKEKLDLGATAFALVNLALGALWIGTTWMLLRERPRIPGTDAG